MESRKENILKILIGLGCLAIVITASVRWGQPYIAELSARHFDRQRATDLELLDKHLASSAPVGKNNTVYISLPSTQESCSDLELPSLPDGWSYRCVSTQNLTNTDGTGWLPFNFSASLSTLPIDPINNTNTLEYYSFVASNTYARTYTKNSEGVWRATDRFRTAAWSLTATMRTKKYLSQKAQADKGIDPFRYEVSSNPKIWAEAQGLIGYWNFESIGNSIAEDLSGSNNALNLNNSSASDTDCLDKSCITLHGLNNAIKSTKIGRLGSKAATVTVWVKLDRQENESYELVKLGPLTIYTYISGPTLDLLGSVSTNTKQYFSDGRSSTNYSEWHQIGLIYGKLNEVNGVANILDGDTLNPMEINDAGMVSSTQTIINARSLYKGKMDNLRIYSRTLSNQELQNLKTSEEYSIN